MQTFDSLTAAREAIADHPVASLPEDLQAKYRELRSLPVAAEQISRLGEFLYANRDVIDTPTKEMAAGLIGYATMHGFYGLLVDDRGDLIVQTLRRELGQKPPTGMTFAKAEDAPAVAPEFAKEPDRSPPA